MVEIVDFPEVPLEIVGCELLDDILRLDSKAENLVDSVRRHFPELSGLKCEFRHALAWRVVT